MDREPLNLHEWLSCQIYGHIFQEDEDNPRRMYCAGGDCDDWYIKEEDED